LKTSLKDALIAEERESSRETTTIAETEASATGGKFEDKGECTLSFLVYPNCRR